MLISRDEIDDFIVLADAPYSQVVAKLADSKNGILFVVDASLKFIGTLTQGDVLANNTEIQDVVAQDICNRQAVVADVSLTDDSISRIMTQRIRCIPLLDPQRKLVEIATLLGAAAKVNLNIGAGASLIPDFVNLDVESDWYEQQHQGQDFVVYDIRQDQLPYAEETVDNIYCSHVIEHIEDKDVEGFLTNCARVLKPSSVLRIACPDAKFLYNVSSFENDFWFWRREWFKQHCPDKSLDKLSQSDFLIREVSTPRAGQKVENSIDYSAQTMESDLAHLTQGLTFDLDNIGNHINFWTFEKLQALAEKAGFKHVIESKYQGSISQDMVGSLFDQTRPGMSLYVDLVK